VRIQLDLGAVVAGPPWRCSCGQQLEAGEIDGHLVLHLLDRAAALATDPPHVCPNPTLAAWARWRWARVKDWWLRAR